MRKEVTVNGVVRWDDDPIAIQAMEEQRQEAQRQAERSRTWEQWLDQLLIPRFRWFDKFLFEKINKGVVKSAPSGVIFFPLISRNDIGSCKRPPRCFLLFRLGGQLFGLQGMATGWVHEAGP